MDFTASSERPDDFDAEAATNYELSRSTQEIYQNASKTAQEVCDDDEEFDDIEEL